MASMSNAKDMSVLWEKKGLAITFTESNKAQSNWDNITFVPVDSVI